MATTHSPAAYGRRASSSKQSQGVAAMATHVDGFAKQLVSVADQKQWPRVAVLSAALVDGAIAAGDHQMEGAARHLLSAATMGTSETQIKRCLMRVIGAATRIRPH
jgi:hypothetical protein